MAQDARTAVVTGAADGIGRATCERLLKGGWRVLAVDLDADRLGWTGGTEGVHALAVDIATEEGNARMAAEAEARLGGIDAAVLNAGVRGGGAIDALPFADFERIVAVNMVGPVLGIRACLPLLRKGRDPAIVVTSSTMGLGGDAENWAYGMTKHALVGLVRSLARELGWEGLRINALCPGPTRTGMTGGIEDVAPEHYRHLMRQVPLQRWADPDEMAAVIEFLVSPAASYVNGHAMVADGGALVGTGLLPPKSAPTGAIPGDLHR